MPRLNGFIDLHTHSTNSDGTLTPTEIVVLAREIGLDAIGLTDHDTVGGHEEFMLAGSKYGMATIPGVEVSVQTLSGTVHILGYFHEADSAPIEEKLRSVREARVLRNQKITDILCSEGLDVTIEEFRVEAGGGVVGRPHMAVVLVRKGYAVSVQDAFDRYLAKGAKAYVPRALMTPREAITTILRCGGVPALAHPTTLGCASEEELFARVGEYVDMGLKAIETRYSDFTVEDERCMGQLAEHFGIAQVGGSDFHGATKPERRLGTGRGDMRVPAAFLRTVGIDL